MILTALIMGFAGSIHCAGMCSPLAMAVSNLSRGAITNRLIYNAGRIFTYGLLGLLFGSAGWALPLSAFQNLFSIILGVGILAIAITGTINIRIPVLTKAARTITTHLKTKFSFFITRKTTASIFFLGSLNGFLPCGLTLIALIYSITLGSPALSFTYMILFGVGTLPVMLGLSSVFQFLVKRFNLNFKRLTTAMLFISGFLLIARVFFFHHTSPTPEEQHVVDIILCR